MSQLYWIGPHGMLVPSTVKSVTASDGYNMLYSDGTETEMWSEQKAPTKEEYLAKYAQQRGSDGLYFYAEG
jgi:hypothetical protein